MATNASSSDYIFFLQAGSVSCAHDATLCERQIEGAEIITTGSEREVILGHNLLSGDAAENALFSTFNRVYVPHCTADMFLLDTQSDDGQLQFRGRALLEETISVVLSNATQNASVVLGGSTAGGVGAFNAARWLLDSFDQVVELSVIIDSAFLFDIHGYMMPFLEYLQANPSAAYSSHCAEEFSGGSCCLQFVCMVQKGYYPSNSVTTTSTAIYPGEGRIRGTLALSSSQHPQEARNLVSQLGASTTDGVVILDAGLNHGTIRQTEPSLRELASLYPGASCTCLYGEDDLATTRTCEGWWWGNEGDTGNGLRWTATQSVDQWEAVEIGGTTVRSAIEMWWNGRGNASEQVVLIDDCEGIDCNSSCPSELLVPGSRSEDNSLTVLVVVTTTLAFSAVVLVGGAINAFYGIIIVLHRRTQQYVDFVL
ncbi:conserved unknown protein [Ectocarpus siliculosus]|uniref:Uncharacterized protein n=1 Tax=Ectocarpus siliculosus TaxID=2880 RepID=D7FRS9_ECTSI|nr:conserved unknown protein [Ectocarpus siliculosus]|eukprot:CBJ30870.1 conserved unknown protein [Ectocarpus siliculosus]